MDAWLHERCATGHGGGVPTRYRGLSAEAPLFVAADGVGFRITPYGSGGQRRFLCRPILETYRKLFRYAQIEGVTPLTVRRTLVASLHVPGADEEQIGLAEVRHQTAVFDDFR